MKKTIFPVVCIVFLCLLTACFSDWKGDVGTFSIRVGDGGNGRTLSWPIDPDIIAKLRYTITVSDGPGGPHRLENIEPETTISFSVNPGKWDILVEAYLDGELVAKGSELGKDIKAGQNGTVTITMRDPESRQPSAADFEINGLSPIYDGDPKTVSITPKSGKSTGEITIYYEGTGGTNYAKSTEAPREIGTYAVTFDVEATADFDAATGLSAGTMRISEDAVDPEVDIVFDSIEDFRAWLKEQPENNADEPYIVGLNIDDLGGDITIPGSLGNMLKDPVPYDINNPYKPDKYVSLDLSGSTITDIPEGAFFYYPGDTIDDIITVYFCTSLTGIKLPDSVTSIGDETFFGCTSLASITIPNGVTSIGDGAFFGCTSLASVTIGSSVTTIGSEAFFYCSSLTSVTFEGTIPSAGFSEDIFYTSFPGDLRDKFYATDPANGTPGTYTTTAPVDVYSKWTKQ